MTTQSGKKTATSLDDLLLAADVISSRWSDDHREGRRINDSRHLVECAHRLETALAIHTRCVVANHHGIRRSHNLREVSQSLFSAMAAYASAIRAVASSGRRAELFALDLSEPDLALNSRAGK